MSVKDGLLLDKFVMCTAHNVLVQMLGWRCRAHGSCAIHVWSPRGSKAGDQKSVDMQTSKQVMLLRGI